MKRVILSTLRSWILTENHKNSPAEGSQASWEDLYRQGIGKGIQIFFRGELREKPRYPAIL